MNQNVHKLMLSRFSALYGAPTSPNPQAVIEEYDKALRGFCVEALQHGADKVISENTFRAWPTIGECMKACRDYRVPYGFTREARDEDKVFLPPGCCVTGEPERSDAEREAHVAETMRMIDEMKKKVVASNFVGEERAKRPAPDRNFFIARGWGAGTPLNPKDQLK